MGEVCSPPVGCAQRQAVLHCFFKSRGYSQSECVLGEMLVEAQTGKRKAPALQKVVSKRVEWELENAPYEELAELILNTRSSMRRIRGNSLITEEQQDVCSTVRLLRDRLPIHVLLPTAPAQPCDICAAYLPCQAAGRCGQNQRRVCVFCCDLLGPCGFTSVSNSMEHVNEMIVPATKAIERQLSDLLGYATILSKAKDLFMSLPNAVVALVEDSAPSKEDCANIKYLHCLIHNSFQRVTLKVWRQHSVRFRMCLVLVDLCSSRLTYVY